MEKDPTDPMNEGGNGAGRTPKRGKFYGLLP